MPKHRKQGSKQARSGPAPKSPAAGGSVTLAAAHAPARHPTLLAVSIVLFVLWFIFLLVTALTS